MKSLEGLRAATRPMILWMLGVGSFAFIYEGITGEWVDWWIRLTLMAFGEWILERPILKVVRKE